MRTTNDTTMMREMKAYAHLKPGQDNEAADVIRGGPNGALSLTEARRNFAEFGACEKRHIRNVRKPRPKEAPTTGGGA